MLFWFISYASSRHNGINEQISQAAIQRYSQEKVLWKYVANLQESTHAEVHFGMGVLL